MSDRVLITAGTAGIGLAMAQAFASSRGRTISGQANALDGFTINSDP